MTKVPSQPGRHRVGGPNAVPWTELTAELDRRATAKLSWFEEIGRVRLATDADRAPCPIWHGTKRCGQPGVWQVEGYPGRVFCAPDAVGRAVVRELMVRARESRNAMTQPLPRIAQPMPPGGAE
ncbi:hypothetical protein [Amycolatopsis thermoflava]|uniref:hypothetical protein n=1 Tax=Amycolatopsis thermoflava TaxID=84480 RepID=UPI003F4A0CB9